MATSLPSLQQMFRSRRFSFALVLPVCFLLWLLWAYWFSIFDYPLQESVQPSEKPKVQPVASQIQTQEPSIAPISTPTAASPASAESTQAECRTLPGAEDVLIVLKTGASEIYEKLPEHLITLFKCAPHHLIFSDLEQDIGDYHVYDILDRVNDRVKETQKEFQYYRELHKLSADGQDLSKLKGEKAWNLDKWKFIPMVRRAYHMRPNSKWFLFIEGDTAVFWANLLQWLNRLNPDDTIYSGSQNVWGGVVFAHGGSGVLMSRAVVKKLDESYASHAEEWEKNTISHCCGDSLLAKAIKDVGIEMTPSFPIIQGEAPATIDWNARHMCAPSVTWHHVSSKDIDRLWHLQQNWTNTHGFQSPYLFRDLFTNLVDGYVRDRRDDWNNISEDWKYEQSEHFSDLSETEQKSIESFENCREACVQNAECMQFMYSPGKCILGRDIRVGRIDNGPGEEEEDKSRKPTSSGWLLDKIAEHSAKFKDCEPNWDFNQ